MRQQHSVEQGSPRSAAGPGPGALLDALPEQLTAKRAVASVATAHHAANARPDFALRFCCIDVASRIRVAERRVPKRGARVNAEAGTEGCLRFAFSRFGEWIRRVYSPP